MIMVFANYTKQRMLPYHNEGSTPPSTCISQKLMDEGTVASGVGIAKFLNCCRETNYCIVRQISPRSKVRTYT